MIYTDIAIARVRAYLREKGVAKSRLAVNADVPEGCTRNIADKDWNPTSDTLRKLEAAVPAEFIFNPKIIKTDNRPK